MAADSAPSDPNLLRAPAGGSDLLLRECFDADTGTKLLLLAETDSEEGVLIDPVVSEHRRDFVLDNRSPAFTGDALLIHGCGRCDVQLGDARILYSAITTRIVQRPETCLLHPMVLLCHFGNRSALATHLLQKAGLERVANLRGGLRAWEPRGWL